MTKRGVNGRPDPHSFESYAHIVSPLSEEDGGGFLITFPDLPGCMSDGKTESEAVKNGRDAFKAWVAARLDGGKPIPQASFQPETPPSVSGRFVTRLPRSVHARLAERARVEGVSLNSLVLAFIAEGLGRRSARARSS